MAHPQAPQPAPVGSPPDAPAESAPQSFGSFMHAFIMDPEAAAARELYFRCDSAACNDVVAMSCSITAAIMHWHRRLPH